MSRVGRLPVSIPSGVKAVVEGGVVHIEGPKGKLSYLPAQGIAVSCNAGTVVVAMKGTDAQSRMNWGTTRAKINNMMVGVSKGWKRALEMSGIGFTAKVQGPVLNLTVGYSHDVNLDIPSGVKAVVNKNSIEIEGPDREVVGQLAARIRKVRPPEPYLGKGIKYVEETIRRKAGKTAKKA